MSDTIEIEGNEIYLPWREVDFYEALAEVQSSLGEGVVVVEGHSQKILYANQAFCNIFGYTKQELLHIKSIYELVAPEFKEQLRARGALRMSRQTPVVDHYEAVGVKKDGTLIQTENSVSAVEGSETYAIALIRDITERKKREEALRGAYRVIDDLYNQAPCGYHSVDETGMFVYVNDTLLSWLGYRREDLVKVRTIFDIVRPEDIERVKKAFFNFVKNPVPYEIMAELLKKDGETFPALVKASAVTDGQGKFLMSRTMTLDIRSPRNVNVEVQRFAANQKRLNAAVERLEAAMARIR